LGKGGGACRGAVGGESVRREPPAQGLTDVAQHAERRQGKELAAKMPRGDAISHVDKPVHRQEPHRREMPLQGAGEPAGTNTPATAPGRARRRRPPSVSSAGNAKLKIGEAL